MNSRRNPDYSSSSLRSSSPLFARKRAKGLFRAGSGRVLLGGGYLSLAYCLHRFGAPQVPLQGPAPVRALSTVRGNPPTPAHRADLRSFWQPKLTPQIDLALTLELTQGGQFCSPRYFRPRPARGQVGRLMGRSGSSQLCVFKPYYPPISLPPPNINDFHLLLSDSGSEKCFNVIKTT